METKLALRIKYGLRVDPTDAQIRQWVQATRESIMQGKSHEAAGWDAAARFFAGVGEIKYAAEADTIEALLEEIKKRENSND